MTTEPQAVPTKSDTRVNSSIAAVIVRTPILQKSWSIAAASTFALIVGGMPLLVLTFGVFLKPITEEMNWTRAEASVAVSIMLYVTAVMAPVSGLIIDRFGVRRPLICSILASAVMFGVISRIHDLWSFWIAFGALGLVSWGLQPVIYSKVVVGWFDHNRGLALGVMNAGQGIGATILPSIAALLTVEFGWRGAYLGLALLLLCVALPGALFVIRENSSTSSRTRSDANTVSPHTSGQLFANRAFWVIVTSAFVLSLAINGTLPHMVPMLTDRGLSTSSAVGVMSVIGLSGIAGRVGAGFIADRIFAPILALAIFLLSAIGIGILWLNSSSIPPVIAGLLLGVGLGAEVDLMGYLTSRYFPKAVFARVYGFVFFALICGQAIGVYAMGETFDLTKSYLPCLGVFAGLVFVAGFLSLLMGPYVYPPEKR